MALGYVLGSRATRRRSREAAASALAAEEAELYATVDPARDYNWIQARDVDSGSWSSRPNNHFQLGWNPPSSGEGAELAAVHACQSIIAQSVAPVRIAHVRYEARVPIEIEGSRYARVLRRPNSYQTGLDFRLYLLYQLLEFGNAYAWAELDSVGRIGSMHPLSSGSVQAMANRESGDVFYQAPLGAYEPDRPSTIPGRLVWHMRARTHSSDPLLGLSPLVHTVATRHLLTEIQNTLAEYMDNQAHLGGYLATDANLTPEQTKAYLAAWKRGAKKGFRGDTAMLDRGIGYNRLPVTGPESVVAELWGLSVDDIARAYQVPGWMIGRADPSYSNAETMDRVLNARTLRFYFDLIEESLGAFFGLPGNQALEHQVEERLAKVDSKDQMEGSGAAIQKGLLTPNEARAKMGHPPLPDGDELLVQQQMVPLSRAVKPPAPPPPMPPAPPPDPEPKP